MSLLKITGLTYKYPQGDILALRDLDLEVKEGELLALVGPNASGKSTLALAIKGILKPESGSLILDGETICTDGPDQRVSLLFSNPENQLVTSIVEEDVAFTLESAGMDPGEINLRVNQIFSTLAIEHLRLRSPDMLSGGEQQMVALAGALISDPRLLILDEPTAYLDPIGREKVMKALKSEVGRGRTVILITHDMEEALASDRVAVMIGGMVTAVEKPSMIFKDGRLLEQARLKKPFVFRLESILENMGLDDEGVGYDEGKFVGLLKDAVTFSSPGKHENATRGVPYGSKVPEKLLDYNNIFFSYTRSRSDRTGILDDLTLDVPGGRTTVVCGANGAGKSTLMQMSNGLLLPDSGQVLFRREPLTALKRKRGGIPAHISLLFQKPERQLFSETVFDDIAFGPRNLGLTVNEVQSSVDEAVTWVGINPELLLRSPFTLSGGQMRRVAIAGVLAMKPQVLVMDEPTDGLDPVGSEIFWSQLRTYVDNTGAGVLLATHRVPENITASERLAVLVNGCIAQCDYLSDIIDGRSALKQEFLPAHLRLLSEMKMNNISVPENDMSANGIEEYLIRVFSQGAINR